MDAVSYIMKEKFYYPNLYNYIDDLIYTGLPGDIQQSYERLKAILAELGLEISSSKLVSPTTVAICLGIGINMFDRTLRISEEKMTEILDICVSYVTKNKVTKTNFSQY